MVYIGMYTGELIAFATVLCWTVSVQFFEAASKQVGATPVNIIRLGVALLLFSVFLVIRDGLVIPLDFPLRAWFFLSLSGIIGFFLGDIYLFKALVALGPRVAMLIHSLAAPTAAVIGWLFLDETYVLKQWAGIAIALTGVGLVILERNNDQIRKDQVKKGPVPAPKRKNREKRDIPFVGVVYGLLAMLGQGAGMVLSKAGMQTKSGYLDAFAATQIRAIAAFICFLIFFTITRRWARVGVALNHRRALAFTSLGALIGPFLGVSLALMALHHLSTGVASTIFALVPICIIPFAYFLHNEHVSLRAVAGAVIAVGGVFLLTA